MYELLGKKQILLSFNLQCTLWQAALRKQLQPSRLIRTHTTNWNKPIIHLALYIYIYIFTFLYIKNLTNHRKDKGSKAGMKMYVFQEDYFEFVLRYFENKMVLILILWDHKYTVTKIIKTSHIFFIDIQIIVPWVSNKNFRSYLILCFVLTAFCAVDQFWENW